MVLTILAILSAVVLSTMSQLVEKKILALSTFFLSNDTIADNNAITMSSKTAKKSTTKSVDLYAKSAPAKKAAPKKVAAKKKVVASSSDDSSDDSSEDEPPKKSKKSSAKTSKKKVASSSESSSEEDDEEIIVEKISKHEAPTDGLVKLGEGLLAIAEQLSISNAANARLVATLTDVIARMAVHGQKNENESDLLAVIDDVVGRGETIAIGGENSDIVHRFESIGHLRVDSGKLAAQSNFIKEINALTDHDDHEEEEEEEVTEIVA